MKSGKSYTIVDFYQYYLDEVKSNINYKVDYKTYRKILEEYFKYIRDEIIERGEEVKLPSRIGVIRIIKTKPTYWDGKHCSIDFRKTREYGKTILYLNEHSDGWKYRCHWLKKECIIPNKTKYQLVMTRANKRRLAQIIKNKERDYIEGWFII